MCFLLLSIISSTTISLTFKFVERKNIQSFHVIVINYLIAAILGYALNRSSYNVLNMFGESWFLLAVIIGVLFIIMLYLIGFSTQKAGITVTTVAMRMAVVIPIVFSILYYNEMVTSLKIAGILLAVIAVVLTVYKKRKKGIRVEYIYLPFIIFIGAGIVDSLVKYSQQDHLTDEVLPIFTAILFSISFIIGIMISIFNKTTIKQLVHGKTLLWGTILGVANFGSVYFFVNALNYAGFDSSILFGMNHIGIVVLSVLFAFFIFEERPSKLNWVGISFSIIAIYILSRT